MKIDPLPPMPFDRPRPSADMWMNSWVARTPVGEQRIGDVLARQLQFEFVGDGRFSTREIKPLTPGAADALRGARGPGLERVMRGVLASLDGLEGSSNLRGMSFATDDDGYVINRLMSSLQSGSIHVYDQPGRRLPRAIPKPDASIEGQAHFAELVANWRAARLDSSSGETNEFVDISPEWSTELLRQIDGELSGKPADPARRVDLVDLLDHEVLHTVTPLVISSGVIMDPGGWWQRYGWIDEGSGEVLATWPGVLERSSSAMGLPAARVAPPDISPTYRDGYDGLRRLLTLGGVDVNDPAHYEQAFELLNGTQSERVPRTLATRIADVHGLATGDAKQLERMLLDGGAAPATFDAIERFVAERRA